MSHFWKKCIGCELSKPESEFHRNASYGDGHAARCKACKAVKDRSHQNDAERLKERAIRAKARGIMDISPSALLRLIDALEAVEAENARLRKAFDELEFALLVKPSGSCTAEELERDLAPVRAFCRMHSSPAKP